ncbi:MAG: response regulator [Phycisphaerae bacterium]|nr:response regulator [Phycisphaerae bacterium]
MARRVLIVEDEPLIRWALRVRLEEDGHSIDEAATVSEGDARFRAHRPDVLLLDYRLPDGSATELLARLGAAAAECDVIVLTADPTARSVMDSPASTVAGRRVVLLKPFDLDEVARSVSDRAGA